MPEIVAVMFDQLIRERKRQVEVFHTIPSFAIVARYVRSSYQNNIARSILELFLSLLALRLNVSKSYRPDKKSNHISLSEAEIDELVEKATKNTRRRQLRNALTAREATRATSGRIVRTKNEAPRRQNGHHSRQPQSPQPIRRPTAH